MWNARSTTLGGAAGPRTPAACRRVSEPLLSRAARRYLPELHANARAVADGHSHYSVRLDGQRLYLRLKAVPFQAWRRAVLQAELAGLPPDAAGRARAVLARTGCLDWLEIDGVLEHRYPQGERLPLCRPRALGTFEKLRLRIFGTPHHLEAGVETGP